MIKLQNFGSKPYTGWISMNTDTPLPYQFCRTSQGFEVVRGEDTGEDTHMIHVRVNDLQPGELNILPGDLQQTFFDFNDIDLRYMGGSLKVNGVDAINVSVDVDGPSFVGHYRARVNNIVCVDVWLRWYPDQKWAVFGEALITCSDSTKNILSDTFANIELTLGDGLLVHLDGTIDKNLGAIANPVDGMANGIPFTFVFHKELRSLQDWSSAEVACRKMVNGVSINNLWDGGSPEYNGHAQDFGASRYFEAVRRLKTLDRPTFGIDPNSTVTGAQQDQLFVYGQAKDSPLTAVVCYLDALKWANRPCHHLKPYGEIISQDNEENLVYWNSRVHWHTGVSPNRLGKTSEVHNFPNNWYGSDVEHWLINTLAVAKRLTGSRMLDRLLEHQAEIYRLQWTHKDGLTTSQTYASRAVGYEGINVLHLYKNLRNRELSEKVVDNFKQRVDKIIVPAYSEKVEWDPRVDPRLGLPPGVEGWMPWQSSLGAYGLYVACKFFNFADGMEEARKQAELCVDRDWVKLPGEEHYRNVGNQKTDPNRGPLPMEYYQSIKWEGRFNSFRNTWAIPALWVVLDSNREHPKANLVWEDIKDDIQPNWNPTFV